MIYLRDAFCIDRVMIVKVNAAGGE